MVVPHAGARSIVVGIADDLGDHLSAINDAYRHDASLLVLPAVLNGACDSVDTVRHAARHARLHVLFGTEVLVDSMGSVLDEPPFETPFGRISTTPRRSAGGGIRYITLTCV